MVRRHSSPAPSMGAAKAARVLQEEVTPPDGEGHPPLVLPRTFDVGGICEVQATAQQWLEGLEPGRTAQVIVPDLDAVLSVQIAAATVKSAGARGCRVDILSPDGAPFDAVLVAPDTDPTA